MAAPDGGSIAPDGGSIAPPGWDDAHPLSAGAAVVPLPAPAPLPGPAPLPAPTPLSGPPPLPAPTDAELTAHYEALLASRVDPVGPVEQPGADAAVRWRMRAATIDNLLVYGLYFLVCLILHWQLTALRPLAVLLLLGVVYHFALESRDGQTLGKRRYGIRVVSLNGDPAEPKAIAIRSVLRAIDSIPFSYLLGLISMARTGPERRQRIGDVVADTKVIAVSGRAANRGTAGWVLPAAAIAALALSALGVYTVADAGHQPLTASQQAQLVTSCKSLTHGALDC
jgi:uncharacterized RDD family membrane protein YckC